MTTASPLITLSILYDYDLWNPSTVTSDTEIDKDGTYFIIPEIGGVSPNKTLSILTLVLAKYKIRNHTHRHYLNLYLVDSKEQNSQKMLHFMENQMSKSEQSKKYRTIQRLEMSTETLKKINPYM